MSTTLECYEYIPYTIKELYNLPRNTHIFIKHLEMNGGLELVDKALKSADIIVYAKNVARKSAGVKWLQHDIMGSISPHLTLITLSNGVYIHNYDIYDKDTGNAEPEDMMAVAEAIMECGFPRTPQECIKKDPTVASLLAMLSNPKEDERTLRDIARSLQGGACYIYQRAYEKPIPHEVHIDVHQMYKSIMTNKALFFPMGEPEVKDGYHPCNFGIYVIKYGECRLRKDGFPLFGGDKALLSAKATNKETHEWKDIVDVLGTRAINTVDWQTFLENYEVDYGTLDFYRTIEYHMVRSGSSLFGRTAASFYDKRQKATNKHVKNFYKLVNEVCPGLFERTAQKIGHYWFDLSGPYLTKKDPDKKKPVKLYNAIIGSFITAYGRQLLNARLHELPHDRIVGYDTDGIFFAGTFDEIPFDFMVKYFGEEPGELHIDGDYDHVIHFAPRQYIGYSDGEPFGKIAAVPNGDEIAAHMLKDINDIPQSPFFLWDKGKQRYFTIWSSSKISTVNYKEFKHEEKQNYGVQEHAKPKPPEKQWWQRTAR